MKTRASKLWSTMSHLYWDGLSPEERSERVPKTGGRPRRYPQCPRYAAHRFTNNRCPCGYIRATDASIPSA